MYRGRSKLEDIYQSDDPPVPPITVGGRLGYDGYALGIVQRRSGSMQFGHMAHRIAGKWIVVCCRLSIYRSAPPTVMDISCVHVRNGSPGITGAPEQTSPRYIVRECRTQKVSIEFVQTKQSALTASSDDPPQ